MDEEADGNDGADREQKVKECAQGGWAKPPAESEEEDGQLATSVTGRAETACTPSDTLQQDQDVPFGACTTIRTCSRLAG